MSNPISVAVRLKNFRTNRIFTSFVPLTMVLCGRTNRILVQILLCGTFVMHEHQSQTAKKIRVASTSAVYNCLRETQYSFSNTSAGMLSVFCNVRIWRIERGLLRFMISLARLFEPIIFVKSCWLRPI